MGDDASQRPGAMVAIDPRYCGPPDRGNGGYTAGLLAKALGGSNCEVTLHVPPPLGVELTIECSGATARLCRGRQAIASAVQSDIVLDVPPPPSFDEASEAKSRFDVRSHPFPGCFVCGPGRSVGDGLRILPSAVPQYGEVASSWIPNEGMFGRDSELPLEFVWAALDCPSYFAVSDVAGPALLGRIGAVVHRRPRSGERLIVSAWPIGHDGRKHRAGTAIHDEAGQLLAAADTLWISVKRE